MKVNSYNVKKKIFSILWILSYLCVINISYDVNISLRRSRKSISSLDDILSISNEEIVYSNNLRQVTIVTDLSGNIIEEYRYTEKGNLASVKIKNPKTEAWIELLPDPEKDYENEFYWTIKSQGETIGSVDGFIDPGNYSLYIRSIGLDIGPDALMMRNQGIATSVLGFIFKHYKRKNIYAGLSSIYAYTSNPIMFEIFFRLSNSNQIEIGTSKEEKSFNHNNLNSLFHYIADTNSYTIVLNNNAEKHFLKIHKGTVIDTDITILTNVQQFSEHFTIEIKPATKEWILYYNNTALGTITSLKDLLIRIECDICPF